MRIIIILILLFSNEHRHSMKYNKIRFEKQLLKFVIDFLKGSLIVYYVFTIPQIITNNYFLD